MALTVKTTEKVLARHKGKLYNGVEILDFDSFRFSEYKKNGKPKNASWYKCRCHCGNEFTTRIKYLLNGDCKSCGCLKNLGGPNYKLRKLGSAKKSLYNSYKNKAFDKEIPFELSQEQFKKLSESNCHYCNIEPKQIFPSSHKGKPYKDQCLYNGIDRVDNNKGYEFNNCISCCGICNKAKRDLPKEIFIEWIKRLSSYSQSIDYNY